MNLSCENVWLRCSYKLYQERDSRCRIAYTDGIFVYRTSHGKLLSEKNVIYNTRGFFYSRTKEKELTIALVDISSIQI